MVDVQIAFIRPGLPIIRRVPGSTSGGTRIILFDVLTIAGKNDFTSVA